jgi:hypothetical protein
MRSPVVIDDYLVGCTIFGDCNQDGQLSESEPSCVTANNGACTLAGICPTVFTASNHSGCIDRGTELAPTVAYRGQGTSVSVFSSLKMALLDQGQSEQQADTSLVFALPALSSCSPDTCDPIKAFLAGDRGPSVTAPLVLLNQFNSLVIVAGALAGKGVSSAAVVSALASSLSAANGALNLTSAYDVDLLLSDALANLTASSSSLDQVTAAASEALAYYNGLTRNAGLNHTASLNAVMRQLGVTARATRTNIPEVLRLFASGDLTSRWVTLAFSFFCNLEV